MTHSPLSALPHLLARCGVPVAGMAGERTPGECPAPWQPDPHRIRAGRGTEPTDIDATLADLPAAYDLAWAEREREEEAGDRMTGDRFE